jgi:hypothetical protein
VSRALYLYAGRLALERARVATICLPLYLAAVYCQMAADLLDLTARSLAAAARALDPDSPDPLSGDYLDELDWDLFALVTASKDPL